MSETIVTDLKVSDSVLSPQSSLLITYPFSELTTTLLHQGHSIRFRAAGQSMQPTIRDGEIITVVPVEPSDIKRGDILLYRNAKGVIAHRVVAISRTEQPGLSNEQDRTFRGWRIEDGGWCSFWTRAIFNPRSSFAPTQSSSLSPQHSVFSGQHSSEMGSEQRCLNSPSKAEARCKTQSSSLITQSLSLRDLRSSILNPRSSIFDLHSPQLSPHPSAVGTQSSVLIAHYSFVLRGDSTATHETVLLGQILGKVVSVERDGCVLDVSSGKAKLIHNIRLFKIRVARRIGIHRISRIFNLILKLGHARFRRRAQDSACQRINKSTRDTP